MVTTMHCHVCNVAVGDGQQFCHACGESLAGVTDPTEPIDAVTAAAAVAVAASDAPTESSELLDSEVVAPPPVPEARPDAEHRGAMPDVANVAAVDEAWWDGTGVDPDLSAMPQPPTQPIESIEADTGGADSAALAATAALGVTAGMATSRSLDSVPDDPAMLAASGQASPDALAPTSTMAAPDTPHATATTDEFPPPGPAGMDTSQMSGVFDGGPDVDAYSGYAEAPQGFRLRASFVFGLLAVIAALMASVADLIDIRTSRPVDGIVVGFRDMDAFGTNLAVAGFIGAALMLIGGLISCFGVRWGAGLAGGAGLSLVGWAALVLGRVEVPIDSAQQITRSAGNDVNPFLLSVTRDLGWFLVVTVAALGLIVFVVSLRMAGAGGRRALNPWIAAVGALTMVIAAAGPLIPLGGAALDVNLGTGNLPRVFFAGRLIQVGLLAVTGVIGFLSVRNYGLGFAAGGVGVAIWLWISSLLEIGDRPVSLAIGNIGTLETTPHAVTTFGLSASIVMLVVAATMSYVTRPRR